MKADLVEKWATALESGEYKQCHSLLHKSDGTMCCLGVLIDIVNGRDSWEQGPYYYSTYDGECLLPSSNFCDEVGLSVAYRKDLASKNDGVHGRFWTFKEIAADIRKELGGQNANG